MPDIYRSSLICSERARVENLNAVPVKWTMYVEPFPDAGRIRDVCVIY